MPEVLVVDASEICRELLGRLLEAQGYRAAWVDPADAAASVRQSPPSLIVLDPGPMGSNGWLLLAELRRPGRKENQVEIVIVTEQSGKDDVLRAARLGVRDYMLKKRFSFAELLTRVRRHVVPSRAKDSNNAQGGALTTQPRRAPAQPSPKPLGEPPASPADLVNPIRPAPASAGATGDFQAIVATAMEMGVVLLTRQKTLARLESVPVKTLPGVVAELISLVNSPRGSVCDVAQILRRDPVLTARVLRVANSANFATQRSRISTVQDAVKNIGIGGVQNLVANVGVFDAFALAANQGVRVTRVWQHCLAAAMLMEKLAPQDPSAPPGSGYLVGLCHDLADIALRHHFAPEYESIASLATRCGCTFRASLAVVFGMPYSELVSQLLAKLRLPPLITVPIEEFFARGDRRSAAGAGSVLGRTLRAINIYAHGLLLAPGTDEPITPLTRLECQNTFGDMVLTTADEEMLHSEVLSTASILVGLNPAQTQEMCEALVPQQSIRVCYARHADYARLDPLETFLRRAAREVELLPLDQLVNAGSLDEAQALVVAGPRADTGDVLERNLARIRQQLARCAFPVCYLAGAGTAQPADLDDGIIVRQLPITIERLGGFLTRAAELSSARRLAA